MTKERREQWRRQCADAIASDNDLGESMGVIVPAGTLRALLDSDERLEAARTAWRDGNYDNLSAALLQEPKR